LSRPNLVIFIPDQLRYDALGCSGNPLASTPNIDALAARGTRFENAYVQHSVCSPSRVSFLTGWYPHTRGHRTLGHLLKPWEPNLLRMLKDAGYYCAHAGLRGDTFAPGVTKDSTNRFGFSVRPARMFGKSPYEHDHRLARTFYHGRRASKGPVLDFDEACIRTSEEWLAEGMPEPWVLYVPLIFPHPPFEVEEPWFSLHDRSAMPVPLSPADERGEKPSYMQSIRQRYGTHRMSAADWAELAATYHGMVSRVDAQLGRIMQAVDRAGATQRTATFFFTDHGEYLGDYGLVEKWPSGQHECLLRDPLIVATPDGREGNVADAFVELVDLLPTICELADVESAHTHFGKSFAPLLQRGAAPHRDAAFSEGGFLLSEEALLERSGFPYDLKAGIQHDTPVSVGKVASIRTADWTYCRRLYEPDELYDRRRDPGELANLAQQPEHAAVLAQLRERMLDWMMDSADVFPWQEDPRFDVEGAVSPPEEAT
jgi:arylsulfatase A-like enzyme